MRTRTRKNRRWGNPAGDHPDEKADTLIIDRISPRVLQIQAAKAPQ
jgi:hypothetical protein